MILTPEFWFLYTVLDDCYFKCYEDDLGGLCGELSPDIWADGLPVDMATVEDWYAVCKAQGYCEQNAVDCVLLFLESYEKDFGFSLKKAKELIRGLTESEIAAYHQKAAQAAKEHSAKHPDGAEPPKTGVE